MTDKIAKSAGAKAAGKKKKSGTGKKAAATKTLVTLLLDRSGSMNQVREQTISALNDWMGEMRGSGEDIRLSMIFFDRDRGETCLQKIHVARPIKEVPDLAWGDYVPRGMTPLVDAAWDTIQAIRKSIEGRTDTKVVVTIQTDGQENCSVRGFAELRDLIRECEGQGWQFQFLGAGINAYDQGGQLGLGRDKIVSYGSDRASTREVFRASAMNTVLYASGASAEMGYTSAQKLAAGDRFDGAGPAVASPAVVPGGIPGIYRDPGIARGIPAGDLDWSARTPTDLTDLRRHFGLFGQPYNPGLPPDARRTDMTAGTDPDTLRARMDSGNVR